MCIVNFIRLQARKFIAMGTLLVIGAVVAFYWLARPRNVYVNRQGQQNNGQDAPNGSQDQSQNDQQSPQTFTQEGRYRLFSREQHHFTVLPPMQQQRQNVSIGLVLAVAFIGLLAFLGYLLIRG